MRTTFENWLQYPGSICDSDSSGVISSRLAAYGQTLGFGGENIEWTASSAGKYLGHASKDTTAGDDRGSKHHVTSMGSGKWTITAAPWVPPRPEEAMQTPQPSRRNSHHVTADSRTLKRHETKHEKTKIELAEKARECLESEAEIKVSGSDEPRLVCLRIRICGLIFAFVF
jgi:hypothetical protein